MLKGIDPRLGAEVLYALRAMGHGDTLVICDTNFPAETVARQTTFGRLMSMQNITAAQAIEAILSLFPLEAAARMEVVGAPAEVPAVQQEVQAVVDRAAPGVGAMTGIERFSFYDEARKAYGVIASGELRFYGCFILTKGVIPPTS